MMDQTSQKRLMVQYLCGELSPDERARFEDLYLKDSDVFQELVALENEIVDQYILGELSQGERKRFESSFLANPARRDAVESARSLLVYSTAVENTPSSQAFELRRKARYSSRVMQIAAALLLLMVGLTSWLIVSNRRMASNLERLRREQAAAIQNSKALQQQIDSLRADLQQASQSPADIVSFTLGPGVSRGEGKSTALVVPPHTSYVVFRVILKSAPRPGYSLSLRAADGALVWREENVQAQSAGDKTQQVAATVPSSFLREGDYVLRVSSGGEDILHTLAGYSFRVSTR